MEGLPNTEGQLSLDEMTLSDLRVAGWNALILGDETTLAAAAQEAYSRARAGQEEYVSLALSLRRDLERLNARGS